MKRFLASISMLLLLGGPAYAQSVKREKLVIQSGKTKNTFAVEIADDEISREKGLMFRKEIGKNEGMLFIFKFEEPQNFWMKNTLIPLDILYIAKGGKIVKIAEAKPLDHTIISSGEPIVAALEIKGGEAKRRGIKAGNKVIYPQFAK